MSQWSIDLSHSQVTFTIRHMVVSKVHGVFKTFNGLVDVDDKDLTKTEVSASIDVASIDTREAQRDGHLKSADFFDAENHPRITFASKAVEGKAGGEHYKMTGDLTIRGTTKEVTLDVEYGGRGKDPWGGERMGFHARTSINRVDFGLKWNQVLEAGGVLVGEKVDIVIDLELVQAK